jgi:predicted Fe-S protein YdhL (DUF1289 family)
MDEVWQRDEPDSPCVKLCVMHPEAKICMGCFRSIEEISHWSEMTRTERLALMETLPQRASQIKAKRRKRR